jgi:glycosyltransferase involved in cell wall biosynthesis
MGVLLNRSVKDILFVTVGYTLGGAENMIAQIAPRLKMRGYNVRVLTFKGWGPISEKLKGNGIECIALHGKGKFDLRILWRYFFYLMENPPDLIIAFLHRAYIPTRIFGFFLGIPNISAVQDSLQWMNSFQLLFEKITAIFCTIIYSCSNAVTSFLLQDIGMKREKVVTIPNSVDVDSFSIKINKEEKIRELGLSSNLKIVGTVCRLHEPKKGVKILLEATKKLKKEICFNLLIVGTGKDEKMLRLTAERDGINAHFLGEREDVREILRVLDVFVLSSLYEGLPVSVLEAMACGIPVIATNVGGNKEVVLNGKTGFLVKPGNPYELAEKIKELLEDAKMRKDFGKAGFKRVKEKFSIEETVNSIERLWKRALP